MSCESECSHACGNGEKTGKIPCDGRDVARGAINEMKKPKTPPSEDLVLENSADSFIDECLKSEINPLSAVSHVAEKEEVEISGPEPSGERKIWIYNLLRTVVRRVVECSLRLDTKFEFDDKRHEDVDLYESVAFRPIRTVIVSLTPVWTVYV